MIKPPDLFDLYVCFDEHMKQKIERNRRVMSLLFEETRLDPNAKLVITLNHANTYEDSKTQSPESESRTSSPECNAGEPRSC